ncbi:MAG: DUF4229 domain-containing protein [Pseudonocardiaceae bacterium]
MRVFSPGVAERSDFGRDVVLYSAARLGLVGLVAAGLVLVKVPLLVAVLLALVIALPMSMVLLRPLRMRVAEGMAVASARRRAERAQLRDQLRGKG